MHPVTYHPASGLAKTAGGSVKLTYHVSCWCEAVKFYEAAPLDTSDSYAAVEDQAA